MCSGGTVKGVYKLYILRQDMITKADLESALLELLRPVVRLCVRYGVKFDQVESVTKDLFVQESSLYLTGAKATHSVSKISVMTGLQRPVVKARLANKPTARKQNLLSKVIGAWASNRPFCTSRGAPRVLQIEGKKSEFSRLVLSVSQSLNPYTVLFELERAKLIERSAKGVRLLAESFNANFDVEQSLQYLAGDIARLAQTVEHNINQPSTALNHHITTEYDNIPMDVVPQIRQILLVEGEKLHKNLRKILGSFDRDHAGIGSSAASTKVSFCSFSNCESINSIEEQP